jgi:LysM repeat protein
VIFLPAVAFHHGQHTEIAASAVLIPAIAPNSETVRGCPALTDIWPCSAGQAQARSLAQQDRIASPSPVPTQTEPLVTPDPTPTPDPLPTLQVRAGDTLIDLASWFGVTPFDIAAVNSISVDDYLQIGEVLAIPVPTSQFSLPPEAAATALGDSGGGGVSADSPPIPAAAPQPTPEPQATEALHPPVSSADVTAAICSLPWPCEQMVRIATCESWLNPQAVNPAGYYGLFQLSGSFDGWDDPTTNAQVAYQTKYLPALAAGDGLSPWPVCRSY